MPSGAPTESSWLAASGSSSSVLIDALWLVTLNRISARGAHELKGALNGVAVNLEVVRSRAEKPEALASAVNTFANAAVDQLDAVIDMTEALLVLSRASDRVEVGRAIRAVGSLLVRAARADGREVVLDDSCNALGTTPASANAVRLSIGAAMLAATEASVRVACRAALADDRAEVYFELSDDVTPAIADEVLHAVETAGIRVRAERSAISISFPR